MNKETILKEAARIKDMPNRNEMFPEAKEFLRRFAGEDSDFYKGLFERHSNWNHYEYLVRNTMGSFIKFFESGLISEISYEREIQIETVSDYLEQANELLKDKKVHPAAPAVLIGASLEEFLRNWLEELKVDLTQIKNSIDSYTQELKKLDLIKKQDSKDIISWGGIRNDAAHGHFDEVKDRNRIKLMLEGVNLFIRKYTQ